MPSKTSNALRRDHCIMRVVFLLLVGSWLAICVEAFSHRASPLSVRVASLHPNRQQSIPVGFSSTLQKSKHALLERDFNAPPSLLSRRLSSNLIPVPSSEPPKPATRSTAVYVLMLCNLVVFVLDKVLLNSIVQRKLYLFHRHWRWWQPLTTCFCHADKNHLSNNLFLLLLFGKSVEEDQGRGGLLFSYAWCGIWASLVSIALLPKNTISIGASGAVFGLFAVSILGKFSWRDFDWRKLVEVAVLGEFVFRQITSEVSIAAGGGRAGVNHVAHLSGAVAGALLVFVMRATVGLHEKNESNKGIV